MSKRYAKRTDANQKAIVEELRALGFEVAVLSMAGHGVPDLLVKRGDRHLWVEVKNKESGHNITEEEQKVLALLGDCALVAYSTDDVLLAYGMLSNG